jgi:ATP-dependent DNA helicase RecG
MGTGTGDMIRRCREVGLPEPMFSISDGFVTTIWRQSREPLNQVTGEVERVILVMHGEMKRIEIQRALGLRHEDYFREAYLIPALQSKGHFHFGLTHSINFCL